MKNIKALMVLPILLSSLLIGCNNKKNNDRPYNEDFIYVDAPQYEPIDVTKEGLEVKKIEFVSFPYEGKIKVADFDNTDSSIRVWYEDNTTNTIPLKIKNIPIEYRHYFGEIGEHTISMMFNGEKEDITFTIIDNPSFKGYYCYFYDRNKKLVDTEIVGYYQAVTYQGEALPEIEEDLDYSYKLKGWNHQTSYIHQDMQYLAIYQKLEKRYYSVGIYNRDYIGLTGLVSEDKQNGRGLFYLGRVKRAALIYGQTYELDNDDITLDIAFDNFNVQYQEMNEQIMKDCIEYKVDPSYNSLLYGDIAQLFTSPIFATSFNNKYHYDGVNALLADKEDVYLSYNDPLDISIREAKNGLNHIHPVISKDDEGGYYRAAIVGSYDIYMDVSYKKIDNHIYEVGSYNEFAFAPVDNSFSMVAQHSYDEKFTANFDTKLVVTSKTLYHIAEMIDW